MTIWIAIEILTLATVLALGVRVYAQDRASLANRLLSCYCILSSVLIFFEFQLQTTSAESAEGAHLWASLHQGWPILFPLFVHLTLEISGVKRWKHRVLVPAYLIALLAAATGVLMPSLTIRELVHESWGWFEIATPTWAILSAIFAQSYGLFGAFLIARLCWLGRKDPSTRAQRRILLLSFLCFPLSAMSHPIHEAYLRHVMPPLHSLFHLISVFLLLYGNWRYRLFGATRTKAANIFELEERLTLRYLSALLTTGAILLATYLGFHYYFRAMQTDGQLINVSGRQRMLSQRIALLSQKLERKHGPVSESDIRRELNQRLDELEHAHEVLLNHRRVSSVAREIFLEGGRGLDWRLRDYVASMRRRSDPAIREPNYPPAALDVLLEDLERVVGTLSQDNAQRGQVLHRVQAAVVVLGILALILSAVFVYRPLVQEVITKNRDLLASHKDLVLERGQLDLMLSAARIANESSTLATAVAKTLSEICAFTKWPVGHAYQVSENDPNLLLPMKIWHLASLERFNLFKEITERTDLPRGIGLPGRVLESGQPIWVLDVMRDDNFPRAKGCGDLGIRSGFAFPVISGKTTVAVLEFFSELVMEPDAALLELVGHIGRGLGQVAERENSSRKTQTINENLERRVYERTKELELKSEEKAQSEREKEVISYQLVQSAKLASVGTLSAGVAHELNNPLTAVKGFAQVIQNEVSNVETKDRAGKIILAADRMKRIVDQLKNLARERKEGEWRQFDLNQSILNALVILENQLKLENIDIELDLAADLPPAFGDSTQIESVMQNLLTNSRDAFESIRDRRVRLVKFKTLRTDGERLVVHYQDNAKGMRPETVEKIFDPFFTTKEVGKGTGLGMTLCYNIIKQHKGTIFVSSEPGHGSKFLIQLPCSTLPVVTAQRPEMRTSEQSNKIGKRWKLILVDDEELITDLLRQFLESDYDLDVYNDPSEALSQIKKGQYDLVLTDLKMPKISGVQVIHTVQETQPHTPVILLTGCTSEEELVTMVKAYEGVTILHKPFDEPDQVRRLIESTLRNKKAA